MRLIIAKQYHNIKKRLKETIKIENLEGKNRYLATRKFENLIKRPSECYKYS